MKDGVHCLPKRICSGRKQYLHVGAKKVGAKHADVGDGGEKDAADGKHASQARLLD
jgi:hypothetical protein